MQVTEDHSEPFNLPSAFGGYVGCNDCDSIYVDFMLNTDLQYKIKMRFINKDRNDSTGIESGEWTIDKNNLVHLHSAEDGSMLSTLKVISQDTLFVDSSREIKKGSVLIRQNQ